MILTVKEQFKLNILNELFGLNKDHYIHKIDLDKILIWKDNRTEISIELKMSVDRDNLDKCSLNTLVAKLYLLPMDGELIHVKDYFTENGIEEKLIDKLSKNYCHTCIFFDSTMSHL